MIRTFKYPLLPNASQTRILTSWLGSCQQLYNACLEQRITAWKRCGKSLNYYDQQKDLTDLRSAMPEWEAVPVHIERSVLRRLDRSFKAFFRRIKTGVKPGFPRFRARDQYDSFSVPVAPVRKNRVHIPKLGHVKFNRCRDLPDNDCVKEVQVRRSLGGRWWISFVCDVGPAPDKIAVRNAVGIDVGLESFATLSDGSVVDNPRYFRKGAEALARRQRVLSRKKRASKSRARAKLLVAKTYEHIQNQRRDFAWKLAGTLFKRYDLVAHEDLNIRGMVHGNLSKSIYDAAWGQFLGILTCKAESAGRYAIAVDPRGTSQRCSACGTVVTKKLGDRVHACSCGLVLHRDLNAARNVLALGLSGAGVYAEV